MMPLKQSPYEALCRHARLAQVNRVEGSLRAIWRTCFGIVAGVAERRVVNPNDRSEFYQSLFRTFQSQFHRLAPADIAYFLYRHAVEFSEWAAADRPRKPNPSANRDAELMAPILDQKIATLPTREAKVLLLRYFLGWPIDAIAEALRVRESVAKELIQGALSSLHAKMGRPLAHLQAFQFAQLLRNHAAPVVDELALAQSMQPLADGSAPTPRRLRKQSRIALSDAMKGAAVLCFCAAAPLVACFSEKGSLTVEASHAAAVPPTVFSAPAEAVQLAPSLNPEPITATLPPQVNPTAAYGAQSEFEVRTNLPYETSPSR